MGAPELLYLDLLKRCLTRAAFEDEARSPDDPTVTLPFDLERRRQGRDWPTEAETMIGLDRLDNVQACATAVVRDNIPGDLIETGVWRGGAAILMRAVLKAYGDTTRTVWAADSFQGLPVPDIDAFPADQVAETWPGDAVAVPLEEVRRNFDRYGLLDEQVRFLPGWFRDTLPAAPIELLALLRLDGDLYESTIVALETLYPKLSPRGFVIVDDYGALETCRAAVDDYRSRQGIAEPLIEIDWTGVYWRRG